MRILLAAILFIDLGCGSTADQKGLQEVSGDKNCVLASDTLTYWAVESIELEDQCVVKLGDVEYHPDDAPLVIYKSIKEKLEMYSRPGDTIEIKELDNTLESRKTAPYCRGYIQFSWRYIGSCNS